MLKPNYKNGSIVNLTSSLIKGMGGKSQYGPLKLLRPADLHGYNNVILLLIDGLGNEFLEKQGKNTFLYKNRKDVITSVFPATTATAISTFLTGLAPNRHALTGWFMYLEELKGVVTTLHSVPRKKIRGMKNFSKKFEKIIKQKTIFEKIGYDSFYIFPKEYATRTYSKVFTAGTKSIKYKNFDDFWQKIIKIIFKKLEKKYIFAYWSKLDSLSHKFGTKDRRTKKHFERIDRKIQLLSKKIRGTNSLVIITGDHGLADSPQSKIILAENYPEFEKCLSIPLCGEKRAAYCHVKPDKIAEFEKFAKTKLKKYCKLIKSSWLLSRRYFGPLKNNPKIKSRIGDYTLIMKNDYALRDFVEGEKRKLQIGNHGALSREELFVPLIVLKIK